MYRAVRRRQITGKPVRTHAYSRYWIDRYHWLMSKMRVRFGLISLPKGWDLDWFLRQVRECEIKSKRKLTREEL